VQIDVDVPNHLGGTVILLLRSESEGGYWLRQGFVRMDWPKCRLKNFIRESALQPSLVWYLDWPYKLYRHMINNFEMKLWWEIHSYL
jgi:hypothetical protein